MSRRMWAIVVGGALAIGAVIAVSFIAIGQGGDDTSTPAGAENRMRLEAVNDEVSCGQVAAVRIYLDDLVPRESTRTPGVSAGVVGFQATLQYDPDVLRILAPADIQLNSDLGQQDIDGDGVVRSFLPSMVLQDHLGRAVVGGISFVPSSQRIEDNYEEGVDPVAKGEPLLLMTVRFTPVGAGTTTVRNAGWDGALARAEPQVFDTEGDFYEPLKLEDTEITVRGGDCQPAPPSPTSKPTSTPFVVPTWTPAPTPRPVDGVLAHEIGRTDCDENWLGHLDPDGRFSLCYPATWDGIVGPPQGGLGAALSLVPLPDTITSSFTRLTAYWTAISPFEEGIQDDRCSPVSHWAGLRDSTVRVAGRSVTACIGEELIRSDEAPVLNGTYAEVPIRQGEGYLVLFVVEPEGLSDSLAGELASILDSVAFP